MINPWMTPIIPTQLTHPNPESLYLHFMIKVNKQGVYLIKETQLENKE